MLLVDKELWRGPRPKDLRRVQRDGIKRLISLQTGTYELFHEDKREYQQPADFGITPHYIPCSNITAPERRDVLEFLKILKTPMPTLIHCALGEDRTGYMIAVYRMQIQNWSYERAHEEWVRLGRKSWYYWWKYELQSYDLNRAHSRLF